jgi:hypothetical protein
MANEELAVAVRLRRKLEDQYGVEEAALLMDRPPGGWTDLATKDDLAREIGTLQARTLARFDQVDAHFESLDARTSARFESLEARMSAGFDQVDARFQTFEARFDQVDARFDSLETRMSARFDQVDARMQVGFADFRVEIERAFRAQTWRLMGAVVAFASVLVAAVRL